MEGDARRRNHRRSERVICPWTVGQNGGKGPMYGQAVEVVLKDRKASISYVQRKLRIGFNHSAQLLEEHGEGGLGQRATASGQREVLVPARRWASN